MTTLEFNLFLFKYGFTQTAFANMLGVSKALINSFCRGTQKVSWSTRVFCYYYEKEHEPLVNLFVMEV